MPGHKNQGRGRKERRRKKKEMAVRAKLEFCFLYSSLLYRVDTEKNLKMP